MSRDPPSKLSLCKVSTCMTEIQLPNVNCVKFQYARQRSNFQMSTAQSLNLHNRFKCHLHKVLTCTTEIQMSSVQSLKLSNRNSSVMCTKSWHAWQRSRCQVCKVLNLNERSKCQVYKVSTYTTQIQVSSVQSLTWPTEIQRQFYKVLTNLQAKNTTCTPVLKLSKKIQDGDTGI